MKPILLGAFTLIITFNGLAQSDNGQISGNFSLNTQYYQEDSLINAVVPDEKMGVNTWGYITYTKGNFTAGGRFESYEPSLVGYPAGVEYTGSGVGYKFVTYQKDELEVTLGNFYEQFGSGLLFRSYEERGLGVDNAMDGLRVRYSPAHGVELKGLYGRQRLGFDNGYTNGTGVVRGIDAELSLNDLDSAWASAKTRVSLGASFVSRYQEDRNSSLTLPKNVGAYGVRMNINRGKVNVGAEYVYKINDPSAQNKFIYRDGQAYLITSSFSQKGLGISLGAKVVDNMFFQTDRSSPTPFNLNINYMPALTKQHTYNLAATLYPYAAQPTGEVSFQGEILYKFKKKSLLGGKYGTTVTVNYAMARGLDTTQLQTINALQLNQFDVNDPDRQGYSANLFSLDGELYFQDFNVEVEKKFSKKIRGRFSYFNFTYNNRVNQGIIESIADFQVKNTIKSHIGVIDISYKIKPKKTIRMEAQALIMDANNTENHRGDWATGLIEYTISPKWFFAVMDQFNYGNSIDSQKIHYLIGTMGYIKNTNRFTLSYGRQRAGIFCVGGVCRVVPAANGLTLTITSSF